MEEKWEHYAVPRKNKPKLTKADQERFLEKKRRTDEILAKFSEERKKRQEITMKALAEMAEQQRINKLEDN